ncbi:MAG: hypothetical protein IBJ09_01570 [Bacteroidia bacterium]|nr:hypothetical protein [Bacteroidia bacterium]
MKLAERFKILAWLLFGAFVLMNVLMFFDPLMRAYGAMICGAALCLWFYGDFKMLRVYRYYVYYLLMGSVLLVYGFILPHIHPDARQAGCQGPLFFLLVQRPLRFLFIFILKREPELQRNDGPVADRVYSGLLFLLMVVVLTLNDIPQLLGW